MSHHVYSGYSSSNDGGRRGPRTYALVELVRNHGKKAVLAIVVAAMFAFAPLTLLYWFNELCYQSVASANVGINVVVKPGRHKDELDKDEPGETSLLQIICEVPGYDGYRELLCDDDATRRDMQTSDSMYVRGEQVYLRRAGSELIPFGLLGKPPVSVWVPSGEYDILVIHEAAMVDLSTAEQSHGFPLVSVFANCTLESKQKTVCRIPLPHYNWGVGTTIQVEGSDGQAADFKPTATNLRPLLESCEQALPIPTPAAYVLSLNEPFIEHQAEHRGCLANLNQWYSIPREWTRDQLATVRNWLPNDAEPARSRLSQLIDRLQCREFLAGWFCYAVAGIAGLVFTRWGAIALVEPWRRISALRESLGMLVAIFFAGGALLFLFQILSS